MPLTPAACRIPSVICAIVVSAGLAGGCGGRKVSIPAWQRSVERYVVEVGDGDPVVLRDMTMTDARRGFAIIGGDRPGKSTDANGVLLAHRAIGSRAWFVYLVGLVQNETVQDIRLAAMSHDSRGFEWRVSDADPDALSTYRGWNERVWRERASDQASDVPPDYRGFPGAQDVFDLAVDGQDVTAEHSASGARWRLLIPLPESQVE